MLVDMPEEVGSGGDGCLPQGGLPILPVCQRPSSTRPGWGIPGLPEPSEMFATFGESLGKKKKKGDLQTVLEIGLVSSGNDPKYLLGAKRSPSN